MPLYFLLSRDIGTDNPAGIAAMGRTPEELVDGWYSDAVHEAGFDYDNPEFPESRDTEAHEDALERANELHTRLVYFLAENPKGGEYIDHDHEVEFSLEVHTELPAWLNLTPLA